MAPLLADSMDIPTQLAQLNQLKDWLDHFRPLSGPVLAELKQRYDVQFTYNSNAIEGNTLTQSETELVLSQGITIGGKTLTEHLEVIGHKAAIDYIETLAQTDTAIGEWEIRQIHNLVTRQIAPTEAGQYRQLDVRAAGTDYHYPPHYLLPELMAAFAEWLTSAVADLYPIAYAAEAHYRFVSIHPFRDGNGRTGRLLMNLLLLKAGFPIVVVTQGRRQAYIEAIVAGQRSQDDGTALLLLIIEAARMALIDTLALITSATDSRTQGQPCYEDVVAFLAQRSDVP